MLKNNIKSIRYTRKKSNYLARKIGIFESHLSNIIREKITLSVELVLKISKLLNVKAENLFYIENDVKGKL